jgi:hypothetical protein
MENITGVTVKCQPHRFGCEVDHIASVDVDTSLSRLDRWSLNWKIEGRAGTRSGKLEGLHEGELEEAKRAIKRQARRGDTINIRVS